MARNNKRSNEEKYFVVFIKLHPKQQLSKVVQTATPKHTSSKSFKVGKLFD
jgi:uncharacterized lipoprotein YajG